MNKWIALRDWIEYQLENDILATFQCFETVLAKMDELNEVEQTTIESDGENFEPTDEQMEAYEIWIKEQRLKHPEFYKYYDKVVGRGDSNDL